MMKFFFYRVVATAIALLLVATDPAWVRAMEIPPAAAPIAATLFTSQAVVTPLDASYDMAHGADRGTLFIRRTTLHFHRRLVAWTWLVLSTSSLWTALGQQAPTRVADPPYGSISDVMKQDRSIADAEYRNLWHRRVAIPDHIDQLQDFLNVVVDNNNEAAIQFTGTQEQTERWFSAISGSVEETLNTDPHLAPRLNLGSNAGPSLTDGILYDRRHDNHPQSAVTSATIVDSDSWFVKTLKGIRDILVKGGIEFHSKVSLAKVRLDAAVQKAWIRVRYAGVQQADQAGVQVFQQDLYEELDTEYKVEEKLQEIEFSEKEKAKWTASPVDMPGNAPEKVQQLRESLKVLNGQLHDLENKRKAADERLNNRLIWTAEEARGQVMRIPRPPTIVLSRELIERLAGPGYRLPDPDAFRKRLAEHFKLLAGAGLISASDYSDLSRLDPAGPAFAAKILDVAWIVKDYDKSIWVSGREANPRRVILAGDTSEQMVKNVERIPLARLLAPFASDTAYVATTPIEDGYDFQAQVVALSASRLAKELETDSSGTINFRFAFEFPIAVEFRRHKVLDGSSIEHDVTAKEIAEQALPLAKQGYRRDVILPITQKLARDHETAVQNARDEARLIVDSENDLYKALYHPRPMGTHHPAGETLPPATNIVLPAKAVILGERELQARLVALLGTLDERYLLTGEGQKQADDATAVAFAKALEGAELLFIKPAATVDSPDKPKTAETKPGKRAKPAAKKKAAPGAPQKWPLFRRTAKTKPAESRLQLLGSPVARAVALALALPGLGTAGTIFKVLAPGLLNPGTGAMFFWWLLPIGLTFYFITSSYVRSGYVTKKAWFPWWFPSLAGILTYLSLPPQWSGMAPFAALALAAFTSLTLPHRAFDFPKRSLPSRIIHFWNNGPSLRIAIFTFVRETRPAVVVNRIGRLLIVTGLLYAFSTPLISVADRVKRGLSTTTQDANYVGSEIVQAPILASAPKYESGKIKNNPLANGLTQWRAGKYGLAWASSRDGNLLSRANAINQQLRDLHIPTPIMGLEELETDNPNSRYRQAYVQIESDNGPGSIEDRLDRTLTLEESAVLSANRAHSVGEMNRNYLGSTAATRAEQLTDVAVEDLAGAASAILQERPWRDTKVIANTPILPDTKGLVAGTPVTANAAIELGIQVRQDAGSFLMTLLPQDAPLWEHFKRDPTAIVVLESPETGQIYLHPTDIWDISENQDNKGLFGTLQHNTAIGPIPEVRLRISANLPDGQTLPAKANAFISVGFYSSRALGPAPKRGQKRKLELRDEYKLIADPLSRGQKLGVAKLMPSTPIYPRFTGPRSALEAQKNHLQEALNHYESLIASARRAYLSYYGAGINDPAKEQEAIFNDAQTKSVEIRQMIRSVEDELQSWETIGAAPETALSSKNAMASTIRTYIGNPEAAALYPLEQKSPIPFPARLSAWDHQVRYGLGAQSRLLIEADERHVQDLELKAGDHIQISVAGSHTKVEGTIAHVEPREREFPVAYLEIQLTVASKDLDEFYPQLRYGGSPVGDVVVTIEKIGGASPQGSLQPSKKSATDEIVATGDWFKEMAQAASTFMSKLGSWKTTIMMPIAILGIAWISGFALPGMAVLGFLILGACLGFLTLRLIHRRFLPKTRGRALQPLERAARPSTEETSPFFFGANGTYLTHSRWRAIIGPGEVHEDSVIASGANETLEPWKSLPEQGTVRHIIREELDSVLDPLVLMRMAEHLGVTPGQVDVNDQFFSLWKIAQEPDPDRFEEFWNDVDPTQRSEFRDHLIAAIRNKFDQGFAELGVWTLETRRGDPLAALIPKGDGRKALLDRHWLDTLLHLAESTNDAQDRRAARQALLLIFMDFLATPKLLTDVTQGEDGIHLYVLDNRAEERYEADMDFIHRTLDPSGEIDRLTDASERERAARYPALRSPALEDLPPLSPAGLRRLEELERNKPTRQEAVDANGNLISGKQAMFNRFQFQGVTEQMAGLHDYDYYIHNNLKQAVNLRTTFVAVVLAMVALSVAAFIKWTGLLAYIAFVVTRADVTRTLLGMSPTEAIPQGVLNMFLGVLIGGFFLGAYKAVAEPLVGTLFNIPMLIQWIRHRMPKRRAELFALTHKNSIEFLSNHYSTTPLADDGELRQPLAQFATMIAKQIFLTLNDRQITLSSRRQLLMALYRYAEHPLDNGNPFFRSFRKLELPSDEDVVKAMPRGIHLTPEEIAFLFREDHSFYVKRLEDDFGQRLMPEDLERFSSTDDARLTESLRVSQFPDIQDWWDDRLDEVRIRLAADAARKAPMALMLAVISEDLQGWAFHVPNRRERQQRREELEAMRRTMEATIERLATLAPEVFLRNREFSRKHDQWETMSLSIGVFRGLDQQRAPIVADYFDNFYSEIEVDPTDPLYYPTLTPAQKIVASAVKILLAPITRLSPDTSSWVKRRLRLIKRYKDPQEQLVLCLQFNGIPVLFKTANGDVKPRDRFVQILKRVLGVQLHGVVDGDGRLNESKLQNFFSSAMFKPVKELADQSDLAIESLIRTYLENQGTEEGDAILYHIYDGIQLGSGMRNSLAKLFSRRGDKSDAEESDEYQELLLDGRRVNDHTRPPWYLETKFLQDEHSKPVVSAADLEEADSAAVALLNEIIALKPAQAAPPFGRVEFFEESALSLTRQRTSEDFRRDAQLTNGDINLVSISHGLRPFMFEIFNRLRMRRKRSETYMQRSWTLFFNQVKGELIRPSPGHRRLIITSPEPHSLERWLDPKILDTDMILAPSPYLTNAAKLLAFMFLARDERDAYFKILRQARGEAVAAELERQLERYVRFLRSAHLEIALYPNRYELDSQSGQVIDKFEKKMPPYSNRTIAIFPSGALIKPAAAADETKSQSPPERWFERWSIWPWRRHENVLEIKGSA